MIKGHSQQQQPMVTLVNTSSTCCTHHHHQPRHRIITTMTLWITAVIFLGLPSEMSAFHNQQLPAATTTATATPKTLHKMSLQEVSDFYQTYPLQSAILTCGVKASVADSLAQFKDHATVSVESVKDKMKQQQEQQRRKKTTTAVVTPQKKNHHLIGNIVATWRMYCMVVSLLG